METVVSGVRTNVDVVGDGPPVLLLHGWGCSSETVRSVTDWLSAGRRVIAPDLPGFGKSDEPPEPWDVDRYADFVVELAGEFGVERFDLIGHSFGGRIGIKLAARQVSPIGKLVLVDSAGVPRGPVKARLRRRLALRLLKATAVFGPLAKRPRDLLFDRIASPDYKSASPAMRETMKLVIAEDLTPFMPRIRASTLLYWGEDDADTPVWMGERMEELIPDSGLVVCPGAGHYPFLDDPGRFRLVIESFL